MFAFCRPSNLSRLFSRSLQHMRSVPPGRQFNCAQTMAAGPHQTFSTQVVKIAPSSLKFNDEIPWWAELHNAASSLTILDQASERALKQASAHLLAGDIVAVPTETVYGLCADARCASAVRKIFAAKDRPTDNPLIVHVASLDMVRSLGLDVPAPYWPLLQRLWPGPLTVLLPTDGSKIPDEITCGLKTVAVRFPSHPVMRALIEQSGCPIAAPSANRSGRPSPTLAQHVLEDLDGRIPLIVDSGEPCSVGLESTVVDGLRNPPVVLRPGGVSVETLRNISGFEHVQVYQKDFVDADMEKAPPVPGMKYRHYSPETQLVLFENGSPLQVAQAMAAWLQSHAVEKAIVLQHSQPAHTDQCPEYNGERMYGRDCIVRSLGNTMDEIARNLFKALRDVDAAKVQCVLVEGVREDGTGLAIMNRLRKAASERVMVVE